MKNLKRFPSWVRFADADKQQGAAVSAARAAIGGEQEQLLFLSGPE